MTRIFSRSFREKASKEPFLDKTPLGALFLHWFFCLVIIAGTWAIQSPSDAYTIVLGVYSYVVDACFGVSIGVGLIALRLRRSSNWHLKSPSNATVSICAAFIFVVSNTFPIIVSWIPPTAALNTTYPWFAIPTTGVCLLVAGVLYWAGFSYVVPHIGRNAGKELKVERMPFFHVEHGDPVQVAEIVTFDRVIKS
jgi:hypothetical protein